MGKYSKPLEWKHPVDSWSTHDPEVAKRSHWRHGYGMGTLSQLLDYLAQEVGPDFDPDQIELSPGTIYWQTDPTPEEIKSLQQANAQHEAEARAGRYRAYLRFKAEFEPDFAPADDVFEKLESALKSEPASGSATGVMKRG